MAYSYYRAHGGLDHTLLLLALYSGATTGGALGPDVVPGILPLPAVCKASAFTLPVQTLYSGLRPPRKEGKGWLKAGHTAPCFQKGATCGRVLSVGSGRGQQGCPS